MLLSSCLKFCTVHKNSSILVKESDYACGFVALCYEQLWLSNHATTH
jgi:hypothetical protein